jgi:glycosyltransferase involved in cell wall biosynthesis
MKISILVPTRKRVQNVKRLIESVYNTAQNIKNIELLFYVDDDDQDTIDFFKEEEEKKRFSDLIDTKVLIESRQENFGETNNVLFRACSGDIVMLSADDVKFGTKNWDKTVTDEFEKYPDKLVLVFGYDGIQPPGTLATHSFISRESVNILGYATPGDFGYNYADNWMTELYRQIDRLNYIPVLFEHMHWGANKAEYDETYKLGSDAPHDNSIAIWEDKERLNKDIELLRSNLT